MTYCTLFFNIAACLLEDPSKHAEARWGSNEGRREIGVFGGGESTPPVMSIASASHVARITHMYMIISGNPMLF